MEEVNAEDLNETATSIDLLKKINLNFEDTS